MAEYLNKSERDEFKPLLKKYLMDKAQRRAAATSGANYANQEAEYAKDRHYQDLGALGSALFRAQSGAGTLGGQRANFDLVPEFMGRQAQNAQTQYGNQQNLRAGEERALGTDLGVANYLTGLDQFDERKKLEREQFGHKMAHDQRRVEVEEKIAGMRDDFQRDQLLGNWKQRALDRLVSEGRISEQQRHNIEREEIEREKLKNQSGKGASQRPVSWQIVPGQAEDGSIYERNPVTGETRRVNVPARFKPKTSSTQERWQLIPGESADGQVYERNPATGDVRQVVMPEGYRRKSTAKPEHAKLAETFEADYARKLSIADTIDSELKSLKRLIDTKQEALAVKHAEGMLKALNSAFGADAVGVEEAERLGGLLKPIRSPLEAGPMWGRRVDMFYDQAKEKADVIRRAANDSMRNATRLREGGLDAMREGSGADTSAGSPSQQSNAPRPGRIIDSPDDSVVGTVRNGKKVVREQVNRRTGATRLTYGDGTTEIINGEP